MPDRDDPRSLYGESPGLCFGDVTIRGLAVAAVLVLAAAAVIAAAAGLALRGGR